MNSAISLVFWQFGFDLKLPDWKFRFAVRLKEFFDDSNQTTDELNLKLQNLTKRSDNRLGMIKLISEAFKFSDLFKTLDAFSYKFSEFDPSNCSKA